MPIIILSAFSVTNNNNDITTTTDVSSLSEVLKKNIYIKKKRRKKCYYYNSGYSYTHPNNFIRYIFSLSQAKYGEGLQHWQARHFDDRYIYIADLELQCDECLLDSWRRNSDECL